MKISLHTARAGRRALRVALVAVASLIAAGGLVSVTAPAATAATNTIWGAAAPAGVAIDSDTASVELGTQFTPTVAGNATGIRYYKVKGASGSHTGTLWTRSGQKLASVTFSNETASGWQTAQFASPVALVAGQSYVVSYHVPRAGRYGATEFSAAAPVGAGVTAKSAGVYSYGTTVTFPTSTWNASQYWVDVEYAASGSASSSATATATPTADASASATPTAPETSEVPVTSSPSATQTASTSSTPTAATSSTASSGSSGTATFPTRTSVGLPSGWTPTKTITGDYTITTAGAVIEDLKITDGTIFVKANNVTLRRVQGVGAFVKTDPGNSCSSGLVIEDSEFTKNGKTSDADPPVIGEGGFTVRRTVIDGLPEGIRAGGSDVGCGPIAVENSYVRIVSPDSCSDWHGDGLQGYGGNKVTVRQSTFVMSVVNGCYGTAPFFYPSGQGNTSVDIDGLLVSGGGYPFRNGMPGTVKNLNVVDGSWVYGPVDVNCSALSAWQAQTVKLNSDGSTTAVRSISCTGQGN